MKADPKDVTFGGRNCGSAILGRSGSPCYRADNMGRRTFAEASRYNRACAISSSLFHAKSGESALNVTAVMNGL